MRLYLQGRRYKEAETELKQVRQDFPDRAADLATVDHDLKQLGARQLLDEIDLRRKAGQHQFVFNLLTQFPSEGVDGALLQRVRAKLDEYNDQITQRDDIIKQLSDLIAKVNDLSLRGKLEPIVAEIISGLSMNTLDRMATYRRFAGGPQTSPEALLSLAISGWLVGAGEATDKLPLSMAMVELRNLVRGYLQETNLPQRDAILKKIQANEYATPKMIAGIVANMVPYLDTPPQSLPGYYDLTVPVNGRRRRTLFRATAPRIRSAGRFLSLPVCATRRQQHAAARNQLVEWPGSGVWILVVAPEWAQPHQAEFSGTGPSMMRCSPPSAPPAVLRDR